MPFTPSHAAAALLFTRTPLLPAALVAGSLAPDLPYYLPVPIDRELTHEPLGIVTVDLAIAALTFLAWQAVFRTPVLDLAPGWLRTRIPQRRSAGWWAPGSAAVPVGLVLVLSLVVGSITHLAWDAFTHPGWLVDRVPVLQATAGPLAVHKWLQHASSVIGLAALAAYAVRWVQKTPRLPVEPVVNGGVRRATWFTVAAVFVATGLAGWGFLLLARRQAGLPFVPFDPGVVFQTARICVASALAAAVLACGWWYRLRAQRERSTATTLPSTSA